MFWKMYIKSRFKSIRKLLTQFVWPLLWQCTDSALASIASALIVCEIHFAIDLNVGISRALNGSNVFHTTTADASLDRQCIVKHRKCDHVLLVLALFHELVCSGLLWSALLCLHYLAAHIVLTSIIVLQNLNLRLHLSRCDPLKRLDIVCEFTSYANHWSDVWFDVCLRLQHNSLEPLERCLYRQKTR